MRYIQAMTVGILVALLLALAPPAEAEPYLATRMGLKCMACHVNPGGGGKRNGFGQQFGKVVLPARASTSPGGEAFGGRFDIGADFRGDLTATRIPQGDDQLAFDTRRANIYLEAQLVPDRLALYIDQQFAPASDSREAWLLLWNGAHDLYLKAGRLFLPFGLRLEDDTAFIRSVSGINFATPDNGVEFGLERGGWSAQLALTNGAGGGAETNTRKQISLRAVHVRSRWRLGASINVNDGDGDTGRRMASLFATLNWLGFEWLAEADRIEDRGLPSGAIHQLATLFEIDRQLLPGQNLKLTLEYLDPDDDLAEDERIRRSLVWEYTPMASLQLRIGLRLADGIPQSSSQNTDSLFVQLHGWF